MEKNINAYKSLVTKLLGKGPFGRSNFSWKDNIKTVYKEICWELNQLCEETN